jgi:transcriptional regulator with XRE-family HTH domain
MKELSRRLPPEDLALLAEIGARIRFMREARGISTADLADAVGISRSSISNVEKGRHMLNVVKLVKVARTLQVGVIDLVPEDGSSIANVRAGDREQLSQLRRIVSEMRLLGAEGPNIVGPAPDLPHVAGPSDLLPPGKSPANHRQISET